MKPDIIRQPLLLAIASILVVIAAAMTTGTTISPAPETMISTPLGDLIGLFQERFPRCSRILCGGLLLLTGILCGRLAVRYGLYPVSSTLTIPLYGLVACGILLGQEYLTESVAAFVLLLSTQNFFACFRNGYAIGAVFRASFFLGLLPLLYAPLLPLPLLVLAAAFCFRRTLREVFVSLCSVVLPFLAVCYIAWGQYIIFAVIVAFFHWLFLLGGIVGLVGYENPKFLFFSQLNAGCLFTQNPVDDRGIPGTI